MADPEWKTTSFDNNVRFSSHIPFSAGSNPLVYNTHYNHSTADIVIGPNNITINKSGLYHFEGYLSINLVFTATPSFLTAYVSLALDGETFSIADAESINQANSIANNYRKVFRFEQEIYISAPATIFITKGISYSVIGGALANEQYSGRLTGYLISE